MAGVTFTWASSNPAVASVTSGVVTGVSAGSADITATSGGVTSNAARVTVIVVAVGSVVIDKPSVFLSASGQSAQLSAQTLDPQGAPSAAAVSWTSSAPDKVSVDAAGQLVARAIGSAQIFAAAAGVRSAPTLVIVAEPKPGALLVTDAQVVSVGPPLRLAAGAPAGVGTEYEVTLQGVAAPAPGTVVLAAETAPVAGKVVSTRQEAAGLVVTLALAPLYQLFSDYDIRLTIELADFALEDMPAGSALTTQRAAWNAARTGTARALAAARPLDVAALEPFKQLKCEASIKPQLGDPPIQLSPDAKLTLVLDDRPGYSKHALEGLLVLDGSVGIKLKAGFKASGRCEARRQYKLKASGWFGVVVLPAVHYGFGAEIKSELLLVQAELAAEGKVGMSFVAGWECGGATPPCRALDDITPLNDFTTKSKLPSGNDMQAKVSAHFYALAGLDAEIALGAFNGGVLVARVGPKQSFDLALESDQAARADYASTYDLKLEGVVEPGPALKKAIEKFIADDSTELKFKAAFSTDISESPRGILSVSKTRVAVGAPVDFTVVLDPKTIEYFLLGYNVTGVELYRKREDELKFTPWKSMSLIASNRATYKWTPVEADAGKYEFAAFVNTQVLTPLLEIAKDSIQPVEVSCFSAGALSATSVSGKQRLAAAANGTRVSPLASNSCADTWVGTASYTVKTPGLPTANVAIRSNITWTDDKTLSGPLATYYTASGSFDLVFNHPDPNCTIVLSPSNFTIVNDPLMPSRLGIINDGFNPPTYGFGGAQFVNVTSTASCPGRDPVVTEMRGLQVFYAKGNGPFTVGQARLSGTYDDAAETYTWDFSRP